MGIAGWLVHNHRIVATSASALSDRLADRLAAGPVLADGAIGSLLFALTGRLSETNHVYEALTLENPDLVRGVHAAYLRGGSSALATNTFGANQPSLARFGLADRTQELNRHAVQLVREAIAAGGTDALVLGSIGPVNQADQDIDVPAAYGAQVEALLAEGVDALLLETFPSPSALENLTRFIRAHDQTPPVIAHLAIRQNQGSNGWNHDPVAYVERLTAAGAAVVGVNCCAPWEALAFVATLQAARASGEGGIPLSAMPNAGGFERIGQRFMSQVNPEYMGRTVRELVQRGTALVGGCCEVHPPHVREMYSYLRASGAVASVASSSTAGSAGTPAPDSTLADGLTGLAKLARQPADDAQKLANGGFTRKIKGGAFAVSVELMPPRGVGSVTLQRKVDFVRNLAASGRADAVDITDGSRGLPLMPPGDLVDIIRRGLGWSGSGEDPLEIIPHFTTRDLNAMGVQSRLIGYHQRRIRNVLLITGDPPNMSPTYPTSTAVFDMDSVELIGRVHSQLNAGVDFGGQPLARSNAPHTHFTIGAGFEPEAIDGQRELRRLRDKIANGVDYIMTQPVFREQALTALEAVRAEVPILVGVMVLTSLAHAERFGGVPGVVVPDEVMQRLAAFEQPADQARAGLELAVSQVEWVARDGWAGLYLMSPASLDAAAQVLRTAAPG